MNGKDWQTFEKSFKKRGGEVMSKKRRMFKFFKFNFVSLLIPIAFSSNNLMAEESKLGFGFRANEVGKIVAGKDYVPGELIVAYYDDRATQKEVEALVNSLGGVKVKAIMGAALFRFSSDDELVKAAKALALDPRIRYVERNGIMSIPPMPKLDLKKVSSSNSLDSEAKIQGISSDVATSYQYHLTLIRKTVANTTATSPPTVAVIDTGVDYTHPDLEGKVILGKNCLDGSMDPFDDHGHGTHVAGIIGAKARNGIYGEGVCPNCKILAIKVLNSEGWGTYFDVACGMQYARTANTTPATKVINMSLGGPYDSNLIRDEVIAIKDSGKILVAAAGNYNWSGPIYPAAYPETAFRVMATDQNDCRAFFSNFSPPSNSTLYNIAAPGYMIPSTVPGAGFEAWSGTSMASPVVAGAVALIWGELPSLTRDQLITRILNNSQPITCGFPGYTAKRIDINRALTQTAEERTVLGRILDPFTGKPPTPPLANAKVFSGTTQLGNDTISRDGFYEIRVSGTATTNLTLAATKSGYVTSNLRRFNLATNKITGPFTDAFPKVRSNHATIILDWKTWQPALKDYDGYCNSSGCLGWEFDLYVKTPSGYYIYYGYTGSLSIYPYVYFPRDSLNTEPLETIVISPNAQDGTYHVFVKNIGNGSTWNSNWDGSRASIQIFAGDTQKAVYHNPPLTCGNYRFWYVGKITKSGTTYTWTDINKCTDTMP